MEKTQKELGNDAFKAKDYTKAISYYDEALKQTPNEHAIYGNRAMAYINLKNFDAALKDAESAIKIKPDWEKGWYRKGSALQGMGDYAGAQEAFEQSLKISPNNKPVE